MSSLHSRRSKNKGMSHEPNIWARISSKDKCTKIHAPKNSSKYCVPSSTRIVKYVRMRVENQLVRWKIGTKNKHCNQAWYNTCKSQLWRTLVDAGSLPDCPLWLTDGGPESQSRLLWSTSCSGWCGFTKINWYGSSS